MKSKVKKTKIDYKKYCEVIHPMKYSGDGCSYVLARGEYKGLKFLVLNCRGQHPCGYVNAKGTKYDNVDYDNVDLDCHGGLTYSNNESPLTGELGWWLGWDYGHLGDRIEFSNPFCRRFMSEDNKKAKSWKTADVIKECINVIDQLKKM